jgi:hypothetical protein
MEEVWKVTFTGAKLVGKFLEGLLKVSLKSNWVVLLNSDGFPLEGRKLEEDEKIKQGLVLNFVSFMVCVNCPSDSSMERSPSCNVSPSRWKVSCFPLNLHTQNAPKDAILLLRPQAQRLILLDLDEVIIDARYLLENENVHSSCTLEMTAHKVCVGESLIVDDVHKIKSVSLASHQPSSVVPSLDFSRGIQFEKDFRSKFGHSVNFVEGFRRREFLLVISFGRSKFKLDIHTVSIVLQACFGGSASRFHVKLLRDRTFHFSVASRSVGFHIYNIGKFSDKDFEFSVNLWGDGGPNWKFEESKFYIEQDKEWTQVKSKKSVRTSVFKRLFFPAQNSIKSPVPVSTVFDRINSVIKPAPKSAINLSNGNNEHYGHANSSDKVNSKLMWVPK